MIPVLCTAVLAGTLLISSAAVASAAAEETETVSEITTEMTTEADGDDASSEAEALEDGVYTAEFDTDSSMFHVCEANEGRGVLTVKDGEMTIHVSLASKKIEKLFFGTAEDAQKEGAELIEPTVDTVTYSDGLSDEVYGFDIPVPVLDEEFDVALIGTKGKWYDHKVTVSDPIADDTEESTEAPAGETTEESTEEVTGY